ncbi:MAG: hypothetical protein ACI9VS_002141 [Candidatus Binatia bacterium]|jgi:hypothetical protein
MNVSVTGMATPRSGERSYSLKLRLGVAPPSPEGGWRFLLASKFGKNISTFPGRIQQSTEIGLPLAPQILTDSFV